MIEDKTIEWIRQGNFGHSRMIDQTVIPYEYKKIDIKTTDEVYNAIKTMIVRGAPAIGIAGAHGVVLAAIEEKDNSNFNSFKAAIQKKAQYIQSSRPTAVNLKWAIDKQLEILDNFNNIDETISNLIENAIKLENEDIEINKKIGDKQLFLIFLF